MTTDLTRDLYDTLCIVMQRLTARQITREDYQELMGLVRRVINRAQRERGF